MFGIGWPDYSLKLYCRCYGNYSVLAASRLPLEFRCSLCSKPHEMNRPCVFRSSQLFAGTSLTLFFRIFAASIIDSAVSILYKILFNANNFNPHKRPILCWIWLPAHRVCSQHGGQEQALKLSLNPIDIELSAIVSPSHGLTLWGNPPLTGPVSFRTISQLPLQKMLIPYENIYEIKDGLQLLSTI